jgi:hypothetical protein
LKGQIEKIILLENKAEKLLFRCTAQ